jgi:hypothetical protein
MFSHAELLLLAIALAFGVYQALEKQLGEAIS